MEKRYHIEITRRNGTVASRHTVSSLPCRIGRGYDMELILDDPNVAPSHLMIREAGDGSVEIVDLGSKNGVLRIFPGKKAEKIHECAPNDQKALWRIGRTTLRIRSSADPVAPETPIPTKSLSQSLPLAYSFYSIFAMYYLLSFWMNNGRDIGDVIGSMLALSLALIFWVGAWALATRILKGVFLFIPHLITGSLFFIGFDSIKPLFITISFAFDLPEHSELIVFVKCVFTAAWIFFHLRLATSITRNLCLVISAALALIVILKDNLGDITRKDGPSEMRYNKTIMPPQFLITKGGSSLELINDARKLLIRVEKSKKTDSTQ